MPYRLLACVHALKYIAQDYLMLMLHALVSLQLAVMLLSELINIFDESPLPLLRHLQLSVQLLQVTDAPQILHYWIQCTEAFDCTPPMSSSTHCNMFPMSTHMTM